jgi:predicted metal-dependent phosphoesterase TrpH
MPAGQPFTQLCQQLARPPFAGRIDLHVHTTCSDGTYSPAQVVDLARRSGLAALAITDHDTTAGVLPARAAAGSLEIISGAEITTEFRGRELHLLAYFVRLDDAPLQTALAEQRLERARRFWAMVARLKQLGVHIPDAELAGVSDKGSLGRRNLAELLVRTRQTATVREAFHRYLGDRGRAIVPKRRLPVGEAIALVRAAGGVTAWAHPTLECTTEALAELRRLGLQAIEVDFPNCQRSRSVQLRHWARQFSLAVTGGSDCHGPDRPRHAVGACSVTYDELNALRALNN